MGSIILLALKVLALLAAAVVALLVVLARLPERDPLRDPAWCELLFRDHPKRELRAWARRLRYFRFVRGSGGGMDDHGDCLCVALRAPSRRDVDVILAQLVATADPPFAGDGDTDVGDAAAPAPASSTTICIADVRLVGYYAYGRLELSLADQTDPWRVTESAVAIAEALEPLFDALAEQLIDPPRGDRHSVCPKFYPSFWADEAPQR